MTTLCCLEKGCTKIGHQRGLCHSHYGRLLRDIRAGLLTWAEAEVQGRCRPRRSHQQWMKGFALHVRSD